MSKQASVKLHTVLESIQRGEIQISLRNLINLSSKDKNKNKFSPLELHYIILLKSYCFCKIFDYGQAKAAFINFLEEEKKDRQLIQADSEMMQIMPYLEYLASSLGMFKNLKDLYENLLDLKNEQHLTVLLTFSMKDKNFQTANQFASKLYNLTKNEKNLFTCAVCNYLVALSKPSENEAAYIKGFDVSYLFAEKLMNNLGCLKGLPPAAAKNTASSSLERQAIKFYVQLMKKQKKYAKLLSEIPNFFDTVNDGHEFYKELLDLYKMIKDEPDKSRALQYALGQYFKLFKDNLDLDKFLLLYRVYEELIDFLFEQLKTSASKPKLLFDAENIPEAESLFKYDGETDFGLILSSYFASLQGFKAYLPSKKQHSSYLNALKISIHALICFLKNIQINLPHFDCNIDSIQINSLLLNNFKQYIDTYSATFTFNDELVHMLQNVPEETKKLIYEHAYTVLPQASNPTQKFIRKFNQLNLKTRTGELLWDLNVDETIMKNIDEYLEGLKELYSDGAPIEKGERILTDSFIIFALDCVLTSANREKVLTIPLIQLIWKVLFVSEVALLRSPYNFEIKIRMIQLYSLLGCIDKITDILRTMDIKSVQYETIGFLMAKTMMDYYASDPRKDMLNGALQFYNENQKECKDLLLISMNKNSNYEKLFEFLEYDEWVDNSYFKSVVYLLHAEELNKSSKKDNNETKESLLYFINYLLKKTEPGSPPPSWNLDVKLMVSTAGLQDSEKNYNFWNYLGVLNTPTVLRLRVLNLETEQLIREFQLTEKLDTDRLQKVIEEVSALLLKLKSDDLSDFSAFRLRNKPLELIKIKRKNPYDSEEVARLLEIEHLNAEISNNLASLINMIAKFDVANLDHMFKKLEELEAYSQSYDILKTILNRNTKKVDEETKKRINSLSKTLLSSNQNALGTMIGVLEDSSKFLAGLRGAVKENLEKSLNDFLKESGIVEKLKTNESLKVTQTSEDFVNNIVTEYACLAVNMMDEIKEKIRILKQLAKN